MEEKGEERRDETSGGLPTCMASFALNVGWQFN